MTAKAFNSVEELSTKIDDYFRDRDIDGKPYTVLSMCNYLNITRETLSEYFHKEEYSDTIKKAKAKIESFAEDKLFEGKNPAGIIFNLKNNFGWTDKQEIDLKSSSTITVEAPKFDEE